MKAVPLNWYFGWLLVLSAFVTGISIGLFFHKEDFLGGYASFRRRVMRLGHISQAALGMMNVLFSISVATGSTLRETASVCFVVGGLAMPLVCYLTSYRKGFRHLFFLPVTALIVAVVLLLQGGPS